MRYHAIADVLSIKIAFDAHALFEILTLQSFAEVFSQIRVGGHAVADENMIELERTILRPPPKQLKHNKHSEGCACTLG